MIGNRILSSSNIIILITLICFIDIKSATAQSNAQDASRSSWRLGVECSFGNTSLFGQDKYSYDYSVRIFKLTVDYELFHRARWTGRIIAHPQYNLSEYFSESQNRAIDGNEFGLNLGFAIYYNVSVFSPYLLLSLGPHYISGSPDRQAAGFIFSDNLKMGLEIEFLEGHLLSLGIGFRHLSNASLKRPNGGINSFLYSFGLVSSI